MSGAEIDKDARPTNQGAIETKLNQLRMSIDDLRSSLEILENSIGPILAPELSENVTKANSTEVTGESIIYGLLSDYVREIKLLNKSVKQLTNRVEL